MKTHCRQIRVFHCFRRINIYTAAICWNQSLLNTLIFLHSNSIATKRGVYILLISVAPKKGVKKIKTVSQYIVSKLLVLSACWVCSTMTACKSTSTYNWRLKEKRCLYPFRATRKFAAYDAKKRSLKSYLHSENKLKIFFEFFALVNIFMLLSLLTFANVQKH